MTIYGAYTQYKTRWLCADKEGVHLHVLLGQLSQELEQLVLVLLKFSMSCTHACVSSQCTVVTADVIA